MTSRGQVSQVFALGTELSTRLDDRQRSMRPRKQGGGSVGDDTTTQICVDCGNVLDIRSVRELKQKLVEALAAQGTISVEASQVRRADAAGVQLLAAFFRDARAAERRVEWKSTSESLQQAAQLLGLSEQLQLDAQRE